MTITQASQLTGVSIQTLRRWDQAGILHSQRKTEFGYRYYGQADLEQIVHERNIDMEKIVRSWLRGDGSWRPLDRYYCASSVVFQLRLQTLEGQLQSVADLVSIFPLLTATVGEIGNNSFDHNLGNWPDMPGIFFGFDPSRRKITLADRGQGMLRTLSRVRPSIQTHEEALRVAFTEILTGRAPEHRGNGLKFVRKIVSENSSFTLQFQTGNVRLVLSQGKQELDIIKARTNISGCFATLLF